MAGTINLIAALEAELTAFREAKAAKNATSGEQNVSEGNRFPLGSPTSSPSSSPSFSNNFNKKEGGGTGGTEITSTRYSMRQFDDDDDDMESESEFCVSDSGIGSSFSKTVPPVPPSRKDELDQQLNGGTEGVTDGGTRRLGELETRFPEAVSLACRSPITLQDWRDWVGNRFRQKMATGHFSTREAALSAAWSDAERAWSTIFGKPTPQGFCGGCGVALEHWDTRLTVLDGTRVHASPECLDAHGERCRQQARAALVGIGLRPPPDE